MLIRRAWNLLNNYRKPTFETLKSVTVNNIICEADIFYNKDNIIQKWMLRIQVTVTVCSTINLPRSFLRQMSTIGWTIVFISMSYVIRVCLAQFLVFLATQSAVKSSRLKGTQENFTLNKDK